MVTDLLDSELVVQYKSQDKTGDNQEVMPESIVVFVIGLLDHLMVSHVAYYRY